MKTFIELWKAKDAWIQLDPEMKDNYMQQLTPAIGDLVKNGAKVISWGVNENSTSQKAAYDFFAVWEFPDAAAVKSFEQLVEGAGWYNYFEQINASGKSVSPDEVIGHLISM